MASCIIYGDEEGDDKIKHYVEHMLNILKQYSVQIECKTLTDWDTAVGEEKTILFIASIDSEEFHTKVKPVFFQGLQRCMIVLFYSLDDEIHVQKFKTSVNTSLKKKEPNKDARKIKLRDTMDRIVCVTDLENLSQWWPQVLNLLVRTQPRVTDRFAREIGVFFKIDMDDEKQIGWLEWQRSSLEKTFKIRCRYNDGTMPEETYIKYSQCVVMYVDRTQYQRIKSNSAKLDEKKKMLESIKETRDLCSRHGTKFQIFVNEAGVKLTNILASGYGMMMIGNGMMFHWLGLLSLLKLISVKKVPDTLFYSSKDRNEREVFEPEKYPDLFRSALTARDGIQRVTSPTNIDTQTLIHGGSVKGVSYQSADSLVDLDDSIPRPSVVCCAWRNIL